MASDTAIEQAENPGGGGGGITLKRTWDLAFADEDDASLAAHLGNIPVEALQHLRAKIAKGDGSTEKMLAKIIDHNSNIMENGNGDKDMEKEQEPTPSTSKQSMMPTMDTQAGGSKDDDDGIITLDEVDEDNNPQSRNESPLTFFETFDTLQSLFPDLSPAFLQVIQK